ncbi:DUF4256 domain-containing protein [Solimonas soli]|uniref:DUF4256 domain-containing protein n=1 Tax=Solimonas soli TaxID=413479 RepID=UPI0004AE5FCE|nr:DUF4256 domain-containing protein [Solimonas soli]
MLDTLKRRFETHMKRHEGVAWSLVRARLERSPARLASLAEMESTSGEPDVVGFDRRTGERLFVDCAAESPPGRRTCAKPARPWNRELPVTAIAVFTLLYVLMPRYTRLVRRWLFR